MRSRFESYTEGLKQSLSHDYLTHRGANVKQFGRMMKSAGLKDYEADIGEVKDYLFGAFVGMLPADKHTRDIKLRMVLDFLLNEYLAAFQYPHDWVNRKW